MIDARPHRADGVSVDAALANWASFDAIIDARSESEFALDRLPGAINLPVLRDAERVQIGAEYKQLSAFTAKKRGAVIAARNIAHHIEAKFLDHPPDWRPLVYCWRGGKRSGSMVTVLRQIGWPAVQLEGGYKAFRRAVVSELAALPGQFDFRVLTGATGSGKSRLLQALARQGAQVLDIEAIGCHMGSVLGELPHALQPAQKAFETDLWWTLRQFDSAQPVFAEAESQRLGKLRVPDALIARLRQSRCIEVEASVDTRAALLLTEYSHFSHARSLLCDRLALLRAHVPNAALARWLALAEQPDLSPLVRELLTDYYDPLYQKSTPRNYAQALSAKRVQLVAASDAAIDGLAASLMVEPD